MDASMFNVSTPTRGAAGVGETSLQDVDMMEASPERSLVLARSSVAPSSARDASEAVEAVQREQHARQTSRPPAPSSSRLAESSVVPEPSVREESEEADTESDSKHAGRRETQSAWTPRRQQKRRAQPLPSRRPANGLAMAGQSDDSAAEVSSRSVAARQRRQT